MLFVYYCVICDKRPLIKLITGVDKLCPECDREMYTAYIKGSTFNAGNKEYGKPLVSDSLAMHPSQISEHNKLFPDIRVTPEGQPMFDNYQQHDKYLKTCGFRKIPQKIKAKGKKIS